MKRHGYRRWHRVLCWVFGHHPYYRRTLHHPYGHLVAFQMACGNCGTPLDEWHPGLFPHTKSGTDPKSEADTRT